MAKANRVKIAEKHNLMMSEGLWLTSGGRVVKPSWGEYANEKFSDQLLLTKIELERGISFIEFQKRINQAVKVWKKVFPKKEPMGPKMPKQDKKRRCDKVGCEGHNGKEHCNDSFGCNNQFTRDKHKSDMVICLTCPNQWYADRNTNCRENCKLIKKKK